MIVLFWNDNEKMKISLLEFKDYNWSKLIIDNSADFRYHSAYTICEERRICYFYGGFSKNHKEGELIGRQLEQFVYNQTNDELMDIILIDGDTFSLIQTRKLQQKHKEEKLT